MVVRELLAMFGVDFNPSGTDKATSALKELKSVAAKVGLALSAGAIAKGLYGMVELAASASKNLNLLKVTFGESTAAVVAWADEQSKALGRSKYTLRQYAGAIGVVAKGLTGSEKDASTIGTTFGKLAVDLKAFFDLSSDEDALNALRSGITGETEPLKRLGIVMDDAALSSFALSQGQQKLWKDMTAAEKTMVRFNFIMSSSTVKDAWGAASREADSFGNRTAALKDKFIELATQLGEKLLPAAQKLLDIFEKLTPIAGKVAEAVGWLATETYSFEIAAGLAALVGGVKFINFLIRLNKLIRTQTLLSLVGLFTNLGTVATWLGIATKATWAFVVAWAPIVGTVLLTIALAAAIAAAGVALAQTIATGTNFIAELSEEWLGMQTFLVDSMMLIDGLFRKTWSAISGYVNDVLDGIRQKLADVLPEGVLTWLAKVGVDIRGAQTNAGARTGAGQTTAPGSTVASRNVSVTSGPVVVNVNGNATPGTAQQVGREVQKALDNNNRNLAQTAPGAPA